MAQQQPQRAGKQGQQQRLADNDTRHLGRRRTEHAQHGQIGPALAHRAPQRDEDAQPRAEQQDHAKAAQHVGAYAHHTQQPGNLHRRRRRLHVGRRVDQARQAHRGERAAVADQRHRHLALVVHDLAVLVVERSGLFVHLPDRFGSGQHQPVENAGARRQQPRHLVVVVAVGMAASSESVRAGELRAHMQPGAVRHLGADDGLHRLRPDGALRKAGLVMRRVGRACAHNAKAAKAVAQTQRYELRYLRVLLQFLHLLQRDIAGRHVDVKDAGQDQLQRAALGPDDQVNSCQVALESVVELLAHQQHEADRRQTQRQQQQVQSSRQRLRQQIAPGDGQQLHGACPLPMSAGPRIRHSSACGMAAATRASCVATTSVALHDRALDNSSSSEACAASSSRLAVGSSARMTRGRSSRARASATRCAWPPESWLGRRCASADSPSRSRHRAIAAASSAAPAAHCASAKLPATVSASLRCSFCGRKPMALARQASIATALSADRS